MSQAEIESRLLKAQPETLIGAHPPPDGREWDCQCARCGSSVDSERCPECNGEGEYDDSEGDGEWSLPVTRECGECDGRGHFFRCLSSAEWCEKHPLAGRENVGRGEVEWYTFEKPKE